MPDEKADDASELPSQEPESNFLTGLPINKTRRKKVKAQIQAYGLKLLTHPIPASTLTDGTVAEWNQRMQQGQLRARALFEAWADGQLLFEEALHHPETDELAIYLLVGLALSTTDPELVAKAAKAKDEKHNAPKRGAAVQGWLDSKMANAKLTKDKFAWDWSEKTGVPHETIVKWLSAIKKK